jgi:hypothetical protein
MRIVPRAQLINIHQELTKVSFALERPADSIACLGRDLARVELFARDNSDLPGHRRRQIHNAQLVRDNLSIHPNLSFVEIGNTVVGLLAALYLNCSCFSSFFKEEVIAARAPADVSNVGYCPTSSFVVMLSAFYRPDFRTVFHGISYSSQAGIALPDLC